MDVDRLTLAEVAEVVRIFQASRAAAMPWLPILHSTDEDLLFFGAQIEDGGAWGSWQGGRLAAFACWRDGWLNHLYVDPPDRGQGHGSALLAQALRESPAGLRLWAFARNTPAIEFYRRRGFTVVRETDGAGNEEGEPDVLMEVTP